MYQLLQIKWKIKYEVLQQSCKNKTIKSSLSMIFSHLETHDLITQFRIEAVKKIISLQPDFTQISRRQLFMATTLLDAYLLAKKAQNAGTLENSNINVISLCIACIRLSCKFQSQCSPKISRLAELLGYDGDIHHLITICLSDQTEVLSVIDFVMPGETFYSTFQCQAQTAKLTKQQRAYFLKLFFMCLEFSTELTQNPKYGERIFQILKNKRREDSQINRYIESVKNWGRNRSQTQL